MKIVYTKHAAKKFRDLAELGIHITKQRISKMCRNPAKIDAEIDFPQVIIEGKLDHKHNLRIVYREQDGIITIITFYPTKKGRYL